MKKLFACLAALVMLLTASALADAQVSSTVELGSSISLCTATNCFVARAEDGYHLFDHNGSSLSAGYRSMTVRQYGKFLEVQNVSNTETLNCLGLLDATGKEILPLNYGDFMFLDDNWVLAYVLEPATGDLGEYKDASGNRYIVGRTDVVYKNTLIGSLTREDYIKSYNTGARGAFMYVKVSNNHVYWLDSSFNRVDVTGDDYISTAEYYDFYKQGVFHNPTQQYAFTPGCTLTADQVEQSVWFVDETNSLVDLQGNVIASDLFYDFATFRQNYFVVKRDSLQGILTLDGKEIVAPAYKEIPYTDVDLFTTGYTAALDNLGRLSFIDVNGNVTASVNYQLNSGDYKGFVYNAPIVAVNNMGKYIIITATHGELPTKYDDYRVGGSARTIIAVQKDGSWGCIDMAGNTVVPFELRSAPDISADGTMVYGQNNDRKYMLYHISYGNEAAAAEEAANPADGWTETQQSGQTDDTTPVLNEGAWECSCGTITNGKFCPECGSAQPTATPEPTAEPTPAADGSWTCRCGSVNSGKFCPECGTARPTEPQCSNCGYKPAGEAPKFCPECGTKF